MHGPFKVGDQLLVELANLQCYCGQLVFQNAAGTRFELQQVRNCSTQQPFQSVQIFRSNNIRSMRLLPPDEPLQAAAAAVQLPPDSPTSSASTSSSSSSADNSDASVELVAKPPADCAASPSSEAEVAAGSSPQSPVTADAATATTTVLSATELHGLHAACHSATYYPHADCNFYATIEQLRTQDTVALAVGYIYAGAHSTVGLVSMVTACDQRVHLFDVVTMGGRLPDALRSLLMAQRPLKIVHDFTLAAYILQLVYNCRLAGAFDMRMAHAAVGGRSAVAGLGQLVELYLRVPQQTVATVAVASGGDEQQQRQPQLLRADKVDWMRRPLCAERRKLAAQQVAYLPRLYSVLLHERMLATFVASCARFVHTYADEYDEIDVACHVSGGEQVEAGDRKVVEEEGKGSGWMTEGVRDADVPRLERLEQLEI